VLYWIVFELDLGSKIVYDRSLDNKNEKLERRRKEASFL
jgi:hypothetical protein